MCAPRESGVLFDSSGLMICLQHATLRRENGDILVLLTECLQVVVKKRAKMNEHAVRYVGAYLLAELVLNGKLL